MMIAHARSRTTVSVLLLLVAGCSRSCCNKKQDPIDLSKIVDDLEANNSQITALQGRVGVAVRAPGKKLFYSLDGRLNFQKPDLLHLQVSRFGRTMFSLGNNGQQYWFWSREPMLGGEPNSEWVGSTGKIDRAWENGLVLRPDIVADALGVGAIRSTRRDQEVLPERYREAYVLDYVRLVDKRLRLVKKMHLDPFDGRISRIDYFAPDGTCVVSATFHGEVVNDGIRLRRRVTLEMPTHDNAAVRFTLKDLDIKASLHPQAFAKPAFPDANRVDLDREPAAESSGEGRQEP